MDTLCNINVAIIISFKGLTFFTKPSYGVKAFPVAQRHPLYCSNLGRVFVHSSQAGEGWRHSFPEHLPQVFIQHPVKRFPYVTKDTSIVQYCNILSFFIFATLKRRAIQLQHIYSLKDFNNTLQIYIFPPGNLFFSSN